jgi:putative hydrolase of the HAD superfamily
MMNVDGTLPALFAARPASTGIDHRLATAHAPILLFDSREPFPPLAVGYTIFRKHAHSTSFPRSIEVGENDEPATAIEYAIWWDWDIVHLYDLEYIWVTLDEKEEIIKAQASWHGEIRKMGINATLPLKDGRLILFSEPGKHAFAPTSDVFLGDAERIRHLCTEKADSGGLHITLLFEELLPFKTPEVDNLVHTFLQRHAFESSFVFSKSYSISSEILVPWATLHKWIPNRLSRMIKELR